VPVTEVEEVLAVIVPGKSVIRLTVVLAVCDKVKIASHFFTKPKFTKKRSAVNMFLKFFILLKIRFTADVN
jgi:hypothetical protein